MAELGLSFISPAPQVDAGFFLQLAKKVEEAGVHSLWINDRLVYDNFEPLVALAAAAGATDKLKLGTSVLLLPYRRPVLLAKTLATVDFISHGRLTLGVGLGNRVRPGRVRYRGGSLPAMLPAHRRDERPSLPANVFRCRRGGESSLRSSPCC